VRKNAQMRFDGRFLRRQALIAAGLAMALLSVPALPAAAAPPSSCNSTSSGGLAAAAAAAQALALVVWAARPALAEGGATT
jgi:hypothetical protein